MRFGISIFPSLQSQPFCVSSEITLHPVSVGIINQAWYARMPGPVAFQAKRWHGTYSVTFCRRLGSRYVEWIKISRLARFRIILLKPTPGVDFGLQKGRGNQYETIQKQRSENRDLVFEFEAQSKKTDTGEPDYSGPIVQGPKGERFVYIDIGTCAGQKNTEWTRRLKIPLRGIDWKLLEQSQENTRQFFETRVPGVGKDGGPNCATVKPFDGWKIKTE